jgi:peptidyl-dipeptidase A
MPVTPKIISTLLAATAMTAASTTALAAPAAKPTAAEAERFLADTEGQAQ